MVLEHELLPYFQWFLTGGSGEPLGALWKYLLVLFGFSLVALVVGFVIAIARYGVLRGGDLAYSTLAGGMQELGQTSVRRIGALTQLAIKEAWRRRVLTALGVFFLILLFASWFLSTDRQEPGRLYISFVLTASTYLVLLVALLLSAFSLPADFKNKTIYTVVTKPVRAGEIILGRIVGFTFVGSILLATMGICSYVFVVRSLNHVHAVDPADLVQDIDARGEQLGYRGRTSLASDHRHEIVLNSAGEGDAQISNGHTHHVTRSTSGYRVGAPLGFLQARVPEYGKISFLDRQGVNKNSGISVGSEWGYRSFIEGNSSAAAIWKFESVSQSMLQKDDQGGEFLPLALVVRIFKTHKGVIGRSLTGSIQLRNPDNPDLISEPIPFPARDQQVDHQNIPRALLSAKDRRQIDLIDDLTNERGEIEVVVQLLDRGQYFGFAQADCYIRRPEGSPISNLFKVYLSIWVQMVIVIAVGVTVSTLVNGPVALLFTIAFIVLGFYRQDFLNIATGNVYGGGPAESVIRMDTQANVMVELDPTLGVTLAKGFDRFLAQPAMWAVAQILPDFSAFSSVAYAADGYLVPWNRVFQDLTVCIGYVAALSVLGFFLLRTREVAK